MKYPPDAYPRESYARNADGSLDLNYYGKPVVSADQFMQRHETYQVLPMAGFPPVCCCGWTRARDQRVLYELIDHQRDQAPEFQPSHLR